MNRFLRDRHAGIAVRRYSAAMRRAAKVAQLSAHVQQVRQAPTQDIEAKRAVLDGLYAEFKTLVAPAKEWRRPDLQGLKR